MEPVNLHLLINHVAVIGIFFGFIVLLVALFTKSDNALYAAYVVFSIAAIGGLIAFSTGEGAEEAVERIAGVSETSIEPHEESATLALVSIIVLGLVALGGIFITYLKQNLKRSWAIVILLISLISFSSIGRTAWLGGKIRHTEVADTNTENSPSEQEHDEEEHDDD